MSNGDYEKPNSRKSLVMVKLSELQHQFSGDINYSEYENWVLQMK